MKACLPLQYTEFNVSFRQWFYRYWIFAIQKKSFGDFYSCKCLLCVQYILQSIQNFYFRSVLLFSVDGIVRNFSVFLADISAFSPCAAADFPTLFVSFLASFRCRFSLFFCPFCSVSPSVFLSFCSFILVEVFFYFLEFQFEFLFLLAICYCNQSLSIIFSCVHHFLISPVWKHQQVICFLFCLFIIECFF